MTVCRKMELPLETIRVDARPEKGQSPEEAARLARYRVLREGLDEGEMILTAHHADDQAETLLLQLLRGSGVHGLAGMPERTVFGRGLLVRPLLAFGRAQLLVYATAHGLSWVEDASNADESYDRNFLRRQVMPLLRQRWPAAPEVLARSATHCAEAAKVLDQRAAELLLAVQGAPATTDTFRTHAGELTESPAITALRPRGRTGGGELDETGQATSGSKGSALPIVPLHELAESDRRLVLRAWLRNNGFRMPPTRILEKVLHEAIPARPDRTPRVTWSEGEIRRHHDHLYLLEPLPPVPPAWRAPWRGDTPLLLPDGRMLHAVRDKGPGIAPGFWHPDAIEVRYRQGGERCRLPGRAGTHELKKLLQEAGLPPWERERLPLVYIAGELAAVGDLWVCGAFAGMADGANIRLRRSSCRSNRAPT